ncbi:hypothetical protein Droror1_Dr00014493 [Drosera rotundifolia]
MADFSFLSSSSDDSAIDELISSTIDHCTLETITKLNTSSFTDQTLLPPHLESGFRRLKSHLPTTQNELLTRIQINGHTKKGKLRDGQSSTRFNSDPESSNSGLDEGFNKGLRIGFSSRGLDTGNWELGSVEKGEWRNGSGSFGSGSSREVEDSKGVVCSCFGGKGLGFKRKSGKKIENGVLGDLGSLSRREQRDVMKMVLKEEERIAKEAERIVEWARQASARMDIGDLEEEEEDDELGDDR